MITTPHHSTGSYRRHSNRSFVSIRQILVVFFFLVTSVIGQDPIIHYTFDENSGPAIDSGSGIASDGFLGANAARTTNTPGGASPFALDLSSPGLESVVNAGTTSELDSLESFTLTTWLLLEGLNADQGGSGNVRLLANQGDAPDFDGISWNLNNPIFGERAIDNFRLGLFIGSDAGFSFAQSTEAWGAEIWTFLAITYDGLEEFDNVQFYVGDEGSETAPLGLPLSVLPGSPTNSADFGIGFTEAALDVDFAAVGFQDDVRVYDRALSLAELEQVRLDNLTSDPMLLCDFDGDGSCGLADVDALTGVGDLSVGVSNPGEVGFDLDANGVVDTEDLSLFLDTAAAQNGLSSPYLLGDTNLDGTVAFPDFLALAESFGTQGAVWSQGDFNGDSKVAFSDFLDLAGNFGKPAAMPVGVPEPDMTTFMVLCILASWRWLALHRVE